MKRSLYQRTPSVLKVVREQVQAKPKERPPTEAEAARIAPMVPQWANGSLPLDPGSQRLLSRWFEHEHRRVQRAAQAPARPVDDDGTLS